MAVQEDGDWKSAIKISDTPDKTPNPGAKTIWRIYDDAASQRLTCCAWKAVIRPTANN